MQAPIGDPPRPFGPRSLTRSSVVVRVVEGTTPAALQAGAIHPVETPLPGKPLNVAIAGRTSTTCSPRANASHRFVLRLALLRSAPPPAGG